MVKVINLKKEEMFLIITQGRMNLFVVIEMIKVTIKINPINTCEQIANIFTKPLNEKQFTYLRKKLCGW